MSKAITVQELIKALKVMDPSLPIVLRKAEEKGAYSDWVLGFPIEFFPYGKACFSILGSHDDSETEGA